MAKTKDIEARSVMFSELNVDWYCDVKVSTPTRHGRSNWVVKGLPKNLGALYRAHNQEVAAQWEGRAEVELVKRDLRLLRSRLEKLEELQSAVVWLDELGDDGYEAAKPIQVLLTSDGDGFVATFIEGNLGAAGDTRVEAVRNIKEVILDTFDALSAGADKSLGPEMRKQKKALRSVVRKK